MKGRVSSFGNPDWAKTHLAATCTAPTILNLLEAGATCVGKNIMDEMAYRFKSKFIYIIITSSVSYSPNIDDTLSCEFKSTIFLFTRHI